METLARYLRFLAWLVTLSGLVALLWLRQPNSLAAGLDLLRADLMQPLLSPTGLALCLVFVAALLLSRVVDWREQRRMLAAEGLGLEEAASQAAALPNTRPASRSATSTGPENALSVMAEGLRGPWGGGRRLLRFVDRLIAEAAADGASDVHLEPRPDGTRAIFRVDGQLRNMALLPAARHRQLLRRLKVMAQLPPHITGQPQDGRFAFGTTSGKLDLRLSVLPTQHGEKAVLRLARSGGAGLPPLSQLGLNASQHSVLDALLRRQEGMILLAGPTGCGKTTTLYASLAHVQSVRGGRASLASLEDPVEVDLPFVAQTEARRASTLGFAEGLRALLRQDPDVLMVGEIRDRETARIAVSAGMSGHLLLSTVHAESAATVPSRMIDLGAEPRALASCLLATLSQRLLRRLCSKCRRPATGDLVDAELAARLPPTMARGTFYRAHGCESCGGTGYSGRTAVFELIEMTPELRTIIRNGGDQALLAAAAEQAGQASLFRAALAASAAGHADLADVLELAAGDPATRAQSAPTSSAGQS